MLLSVFFVDKYKNPFFNRSFPRYSSVVNFSLGQAYVIIIRRNKFWAFSRLSTLKWARRIHFLFLTSFWIGFLAPSLVARTRVRRSNGLIRSGIKNVWVHFDCFLVKEFRSSHTQGYVCCVLRGMKPFHGSWFYERSFFCFSF